MKKAMTMTTNLTCLDIDEVSGAWKMAGHWAWRFVLYYLHGYLDRMDLVGVSAAGKEA